MEETFEERIDELRKLYAEADSAPQEVVERYVGALCSAIIRHAEDLGALRCRQMLAEALQLPLERPSFLYSGLLKAATKMAALFPEFHYIPFLNLWKPNENLRPDDFNPQKGKDGKTYPALTERMVKQVYHSLMLRPEEHLDFELTDHYGYLPICPMVVTKVIHTVSNERHLYFVQLTNTKGESLTCEMHLLKGNPLTSDPKKRNYVNIGQVYDVILRKRDKGLKVIETMLSKHKITDLFKTEVGFVEHHDAEHEHIHIYDGQSRHFVSSGQRFVKAEQDSLVEFVPIIPKNSGFKMAIVVNTYKPQERLAEEFPWRELTITAINKEKGFCTWELADKSHPIVETLSDFQKANGEESEMFTNGFLDLQIAEETNTNLAVGSKGRALIYLHRGKDKKKRPRIARIQFE